MAESRVRLSASNLRELLAAIIGEMSVASVLAAVGAAIAGGSLVAWALAQTLEPTHVEPRDTRQGELFVKRHPCPATGKIQGECPGYVIDYVKPLCAGGAERLSNMQWRTVAEARKKEREGRKMC